MPLSLFEGALGGVGLFLLGMRFLSVGIRTVVDDRLRSILARLTSGRLISLFFGTLLSLSLNSAGAAIIFVIGLANGGVLNVFQAINILGGVLIGASLALHLPHFPYALVATPLVFVGVILKFFARRRRYANAGDLVLGAGLLFMGLSLLESSFKPYDNHPFYTAFNGLFLTASLPAMIFGAITSWFVQSSHSFVYFIHSLITGKMVTAEIASIITLGGIIGVASIGVLASIGGASVSRKIAAFFLGLTLLVILPFVLASPLLLKTMDGHFHLPAGNYYFYQLTWIHTVASILSAIAATALSGVASRLPGAKDERGGIVPQPSASYLDTRIINTPTLAIEQARKEIVRMISIALFMCSDLRKILNNFDSRRAAAIRQHEEVLDALNHEITSFLALLAHSSNSNPETSYEIPSLLQTVTDLEHIGDRTSEILDCIVQRKEANLYFSEAAMTDLKRISDMVGNLLGLIKLAAEADKNFPQEELHSRKSEARAIFDQIKETHYERICGGICSPRTAMIFNEITDAYMRITELCWNIMAVQGRKKIE